MNYNLFREETRFDKKRSEEVKILFWYRYISLFITSIFFLFITPDQAIDNKIFIVVCIVISSIILNYLYIRNIGSKSKIKLLVLIETIGNSIILIPSGGINSPFVWYSLNTILISSIELSNMCSWTSLLAYLSSSTWISYLVFNSNNFNLIELLKKESNIILSLILITALVQWLSKYIKQIQYNSERLEETNIQLKVANEKIKESIDYTMKLYQAIYLLSSQSDKASLIELINSYTVKIIKTDKALFCTYSKNEDKIDIKTIGICEEQEKKLRIKISHIWNNISDYKIPIEIYIDDKVFLLAPVKSNYKVYGILGIQLTSNKKDLIYEEDVYEIKFLSELISMVFERLDLAEITERLLITEEQNRIANEIHDGVLQRLFSISCGIFASMKKIENQDFNNVHEELNFIRKSINNSMKELRSTIYDLSWRKNGEDKFLTDVKNYIDEIKRLNKINIDFNIIGNSELLSIVQKKALYRIICEGIGNGVRHGKADNIQININIQNNVTLLEILDNGIGFDIHEAKDCNERGLGIENMYSLTAFLKGKIDFDSIKGMGTTIRINIPNNDEVLKKERII